MNLKTETGRSMVEMLGTLAIIGVLSIGGIAGYSYGMDKHRCNQTMRDISLRTVDLLDQLSTGKVPNLTGWEKEQTIYPINVVRNNQLGQYALAVDNVPSRVCKMIGDSLKGQVDIYIGSEILETKTNTADDPCDESEKNTMEFYFNPVFVKCTQDSDCGEDSYCDMDTGWCFDGEKPIGTLKKECTTDADCGQCGGTCSDKGVCSGYWDNVGDDCTINEPNDGICHWEQCLPKGCNDTDRPCQQTGEYCANQNKMPTSGCKTFYEGEYGTCVKADFKGFKFKNKTYAVSNTYISWWDGDAACKALGYTGLIGVNDLVTGWTGIGDSESHPLTELGEALYAFVGGRYIWTSNIYDSCRAYTVAIMVGNPYVYHRSRKDLPPLAVCK